VKKILVFTATYNEADNVASFVQAVFEALPECEMLVVDDNSPDGTGELLEELRLSYPRLHAVHRPSKNGLGSAHKLAIKYALAQGADVLITMDADFSHDPKYLPEMLRQLAHAEFVIGSRYMAGGSCEYPPSRVFISRIANSMTRALLGIPVHEATTSFRGFRRSLLRRLNVDAIHSDGYSYFVESIYQISLLVGANGAAGMAEFPIRLIDRRAGTTKISRKEIWKGFTTLARLAAGRLLPATKAEEDRPPASPPAEDRALCNACGSPYHVVEYPASNHEPATATTFSCTGTGHASHGRIVQCLSCGLVYTNPQPNAEEVLALYAQVEDETYLDNIDARVETFKYNLDAIGELLPKTGRLLELGSYCGIFLRIARERGLEVLGVEPSVWASSYAREILEIPTITGSIEDLPADTAPFDLICSWDVLEHVADPSAELARINRRLRAGGIFAFSTLDYGNWYPRLLGERWPWMIDMHLYYFDKKVMKQMLERAGFRSIETRNYCHIITFDYFLRKLDAMGVPGAEIARTLVAGTPLRTLTIPFRFGDIQLFVCEKVRESPQPGGQRLDRASGSI
jgi:SAM-dependent methyltransferase